MNYPTTMKYPLAALLYCLAASGGFAQALAPELVPAATKYKADIAAFEVQRTAAVAQAQRAYSAALDAAEKTATATGNLSIVAGITKERGTLASGLMAPEFPDGLPKTLQTIRKTYLDEAARLRTSEANRRAAIDAEYLRALASLQTKAATNPELAQQVTAEKQKLLATVAPSGAAAPATTGGGASGGRNALINGSFDLADAEGRPTGWLVPNAGGVTFKVVREGTNNLLHATATGEALPLYVRHEVPVPVPARAKTVTVKGRIHGKWETRDTKDENWGATIDATFLGADDQKFGEWIILVGGRESGWKTLSKTVNIPTGAKAVYLHFGFQFVTGTFDFDDLAVEFR